MVSQVCPFKQIGEGELDSTSSPVQTPLANGGDTNYLQATSSQIQAIVDASLSGTDVSGFGYLFTVHGASPQAVTPTPQSLLVDGAGGEINELKNPFAAHQFIRQDNGAVFQPFGLDNTYTVEVRLALTPEGLNTTFTVALDIGGTQNIIDSQTEVLELGANVQHLKTFKFDFFTRQTFQDNGGRFMVSSSSNTSIDIADFRVFPRSVP